MAKNYHKFYNEPAETEVEDVVEETVETSEEEIVEPAEEAIDEPVVEEPVPEPEPQVVAPVATKARIGRLYNTEKLNVRKAPGGEIAQVIDNKQTVTIIDDSNPDWFEISEPVKGFVMKKFIAE